jgi:hypothetical protein
MRKAIHHISRWLIKGLEVAGILAIVALVAWLGLLWRLTQGPLNVDWLTTYLARSMAEQSSFTFNIGSTELTWRGRLQPLEIQMNHVLITRTDKTPVLSVDRVNVQLSKRHLLFARIVPRAIEIHGPALRVMRTEDGRFLLNLGEAEVPKPEQGPQPPAAPNAGADLIRALLARLQERQLPLFGGLHEISITDASAMYDDHALGASWKARDVDIHFIRDRQGIASEANARFDLGPAHTAALRVTASYNWNTHGTDALVSFSGLVPALVAQNSEKLKDLSGVNLPLKGSLALRLDPDFAPAETRFNLGSDAGTFAGFGLYARPVPIKGLYVSGHADLKTLEGEIEKCHVDLGGPQVDASVASTPKDGKAIVTVKAALTNMPFSDLKSWWPERVAASPRSWVTEHLSEGKSQKATLDLGLSVEGKGADRKIGVTRVSGRIDFTDIKADYFPPLRPVTGIDGFAVYDDKTMDLDVRDGRLGDMKMKPSKIHLSDLDEPGGAIPRIDIAVGLHGPLKTALEVINSKPLEYPKMFGISPATVKGEGDVDLTFNFPLKMDLLIKEVKITAKAKLDNVLIENMVSGMPLSGGPMKLDLDNDGMTLEGKGKLSDAPLDFKWLRNFADDAKVREKVEARLPLDGPMMVKFGAPASLKLAGAMPADVTYTLGGDKTSVLALKGVLRDLSFTLPMANYSKAAGVPGALSFLLHCVNGKAREMTDIDMKTDNAEFRGALSFDDDGLSKAAVTKAVYGDTDAALTASKGKDGLYTLRITGKQADLSSYMQDDGKPGDDAEALKPSDPFDVTLDMGRVIAGKGKYIDKVTARIVSNKWRRLDRLEMDGIAGAPFAIRYLPAANGHSLSFQAQDAGTTLSALGFTEAVKRGRLSVSAVPRAGGGPRDLAGTVVLSDFTLVNAPVLARLFNALSLTGLLDLLNNKGMEFHKAKVEFFWTDHGPPAQQQNARALQLKDGETSGSSLGLTFEGHVDEWKKTYDLSGTIIPVSDINKLVASIPLVGNIITGGSGSVFAATYSISGPKADPKVSVNPVSILAPGLVRKLFFQK